MDIKFIFEGRTVTEVARAAGVNVSTASRWKDGKKPNGEHLARLLAAGLITAKDIRAAGSGQAA